MLVPSAAVFLLTAGFIITKTARDALYIQNDGLRQVSLAFIFIAVLSIPQARMVLMSITRFGPRRTRVGLLVLTASCMTLYFPFATAGSGLANDVFFVGVPLVFSVLFSVTWLLTSELLEGRGRPVVARAFSRVAVASMLGGSVGAAAARPLAAVLGPRGLLLIGAGLVGMVAVVIVFGHGRFPVATSAPSSPQDARSPRMMDVVKSRYTRLLMAIAVTGAFAAVMIDFQFYANAALSRRGGDESAGYFASVYFVVNAGALAFQLLFGSRLQRYVGIAGALMVLPLVLFGGGTALVLGGAYMMGASVRVAEGGLRSSIHRSNWEQAFVGIAHRARPVAKVVVDGVSAKLAAGIAAIMIYGWLTYVVADGDLSGHETTWISASIVASTILWLIATVLLRRNMRSCTPEPYPFMAAPLPDS